MMWGICIGLVAGALLMNLAVEEEHKINEKLKKAINNIQTQLKQKNNKLEKFKISIEEIIKSEDLMFDKIEKIKELIHDYQSEN